MGDAVWGGGGGGGAGSVERRCIKRNWEDGGIV